MDEDRITLEAWPKRATGLSIQIHIVSVGYMRAKFDQHTEQQAGVEG